MSKIELHVTLSPALLYLTLKFLLISFPSVVKIYGTMETYKLFFWKLKIMFWLTVTSYIPENNLQNKLFPEHKNLNSLHVKIKHILILTADVKIIPNLAKCNRVWFLVFLYTNVKSYFSFRLTKNQNGNWCKCYVSYLFVNECILVLT